MSFCHHLQARKIENFNFWKKTVVLNYESDWDLLSKNKHFNFPGLQMIANANCCLEPGVDKYSQYIWAFVTCFQDKDHSNLKVSLSIFWKRSDQFTK